jgi:hypothetical protein
VRGSEARARTKEKGDPGEDRPSFRAVAEPFAGTRRQDYLLLQRMLHMRSLAAQPQPPPDFFLGAGAVVDDPLDELELLLDDELELPELEPEVFFLVVVPADLVGAASLSASPVEGALASAVGS